MLQRFNRTLVLPQPYFLRLWCLNLNVPLQRSVKILHTNNFRSLYFVESQKFIITYPMSARMRIIFVHITGKLYVSVGFLKYLVQKLWANLKLSPQVYTHHVSIFCTRLPPYLRIL